MIFGIQKYRQFQKSYNTQFLSKMLKDNKLSQKLPEEMIASSKNLLPAHIKTNLSRRQTLNHIDSMLETAKNLTSLKSINDFSLSFNNKINESNNQSANNSILDNIFSNISKLEHKKKKRRKRRNNSSDSEEEDRRRKPHLQKIEIDSFKQLQKSFRSRQKVQEEIDEFISTYKSINLNKSKFDNTTLNNEEDNQNRKSRRNRPSAFNNKNNSFLESIQKIHGLGDIDESFISNKTNNAKKQHSGDQSKVNFNGISGWQQNEDISFDKQGLKKTDLEHSQSSNFDQNKENLYSFRNKKKTSKSINGQDQKSHFSQTGERDRFPQKRGLESSFSANELSDEEDILDMHGPSLLSKNKFANYASSHPDYGIHISRQKIGEILWRIRNRIMVSMISIDSAKKQLPRTNQIQIDVRFKKETKQVREIVQKFTQRPRWNSPKGHQKTLITDFVI